jgi:hypothetical protein
MATTDKATDKSRPFFINKNRGFGTINPARDDLLHPESFVGLDDDSATETQYFGFSVPEAHIHALTYMWWHPNLKVCSGGLFVFQGVKKHVIEAEICDWRIYMSDSAVANDLHEFRFDNGYGVKVVDPFKQFHLTYEDQGNGNAVDLTIDAVLPAVMTSDGNHFEQTMKVTGDLVLRGERHAVDCYNVRDRSWGKARPETLMPLPPNSWMCGTFRDDFSFNCTMLDHASGQPERGGEYAVPDDQALNQGWVHRDGQLGLIVGAHKRAIRAPGDTACSGLELEFTDEHGREFAMKGSLVAACPILPWINALTVINLMRWDCDGLVGYGDNQEVFWNPYLNSAAFRGV